MLNQNQAWLVKFMTMFLVSTVMKALKGWTLANPSHIVSVVYLHWKLMFWSCIAKLNTFPRWCKLNSQSTVMFLCHSPGLQNWRIITKKSLPTIILVTKHILTWFIMQTQTDVILYIGNCLRGLYRVYWGVLSLIQESYTSCSSMKITTCVHK